MPINAPLGRSIVFTAVFFDTSDAVTVPTSATMTVTYPPSSNSITTVSCSIGMTAIGNQFTATWASSVAALGNSSYSASAPGQAAAAPGSAGTLRLIS
jgi:hypothetical protein